MPSYPARTLINFLLDHQYTLATAESVTCGKLAFGFRGVTGTSEAFLGGLICYTEDSKKALLGISKTQLKKYTAESQEVTDQLAKNLNKLFKTDVSFAITGLASPGGSENEKKPVGTIFYSVFFKNILYRDKKVWKGSPSDIIKKSCSHGYEFILKVIKN